MPGSRPLTRATPDHRARIPLPIMHAVVARQGGILISIFTGINTYIFEYHKGENECSKKRIRKKRSA